MLPNNRYPLSSAPLKLAQCFFSTLRSMEDMVEGRGSPVVPKVGSLGMRTCSGACPSHGPRHCLSMALQPRPDLPSALLTWKRAAAWPIYFEGPLSALACGLHCLSEQLWAALVFPKVTHRACHHLALKASASPAPGFPLYTHATGCC